MAAALPGCGGATEPVATPAPTATATPAPADPAVGRVALAYLRAVMRNDYDAALPMVASEQRDVLKALALGDGTGKRAKVTADVSVGEVVVDGDRASVSIVGRLCRRVGGGAPDCVENDDPRTDSPMFRVSLVKQRGWKVVYNFGEG